MKLIDFSQGIKSSEIQHNFDALQDQLNKERITVSGPGLSYGFDFTLKDFQLVISKGSLIDNNGDEVEVEECTIDIAPPILLPMYETLIVDEHNRIVLSETPYSITQNTISQNVDIENCGIVVLKTGTEDSVAIVNIEEDTLSLKTSYGQLAGTSVDVTYFCTYKRRDLIYIDKNFKVQYLLGVTSPSPSVPIPYDEDYSYVLGFIEVNGHSLDVETELVKARASVIKEFKSVRNVYTDADNNLYLCGTPFNSLKVIHLTEPNDPEENTFWYDLSSNKLKIWRATDSYTFSKRYTIETSDPNAKFIFTTEIPYLYGGGQLKVYANDVLLNSAQYEEGSDLLDSQKAIGYVFTSSFEILEPLKRGDVISYRIERTDGYQEWVSINDSSYNSIEERKLWTPEMIENAVLDCEHDKQLFLFHAKTDRGLMFTPNKNCLEILINQIPLHNDQFREITLYDTIAGNDATNILNKMAKYYGFNEDININKLSEEYENFGIGFLLDAPLDKNSYVEARVTQNVNATSIAKRFQRTATFIKEDTVHYKELIIGENGSTTKNTQVFNVGSKYKYGENQLEVYVNGRRLTKDIEFVEMPDSETLKGSNCSSFEIKISALRLLNNDIVTYKVTSNVYSYDHVEALLSNFEKDIDDCIQIVEDSRVSVETTNSLVTKKIEVVDGQITSLQKITSNLDENYIRKDAIVPNANINTSITNGVMSNSFYETIIVTANRQYDITSICDVKDFTLLFNTNDSNGNKILKRGNDVTSDYSIDRVGEAVVLNLLSPSITEGHLLYLTGIRFGI